MLKANIRQGGTYLAKISGRVVPCRVDAIEEQYSIRDRYVTVYRVTNLVTGRRTTFRSAAKFRGEVRT